MHQLTLLQIDPTATIAPSADLVAWSRLGASFQPPDLQRALEQDRTLFERDAMVRPMSDWASTSRRWKPFPWDRLEALLAES